jgi:phospholipase/lecithinase/hemolysin
MRLKTLCFAAVLASASLPAFAAPISALYVFGDSLSDNGNLSAAVFQNFGLVVPVAPYAPGRATNGPVAAEVLAAGLGLAPLLPVAVGGTNYAVIGAATGEVVPAGGGAPADNFAEVLLGQPLPISTALVYQVGGFLLANPGPLDPEALFMVWAGANDFYINGQAPGTVIPNAVGNIAGSIAALYGAGARRFVVPNLPDLSLAPDGDPTLQPQSVAFNVALAQQLALLSQLPGMNLVAFDTFAALNAIRANPAAFGLTNVTDACVTGNVLVVVAYCGATVEDEFLFWDGSHPTARGHELLGLALTDAVQESVPEPATMTLTALALASLALGRRRIAA